MYHFLNGDALKDRFPTDIPGELIVCRECLVDGPVQANELSNFFQHRAEFLSDHYPNADVNYFLEVVPAFEKLLAIPAGSEVNLWFEDDLFCQVNLWFTIYLLQDLPIQLFLVRPDHLSPYGFSAYSQMELKGLFIQRRAIEAIEPWTKLWDAYQQGNNQALLKLADQMEAFPFVLEAAKAQAERTPTKGDKGRPERTLVKIMNELETDEFGPVFQEFCKREAIYGFGDLQVKRLYDRVVGSIK